MDKPNVYNHPTRTRPVDSGGAGPHDPGMESRIAKLEAHAEFVRADLTDLKSDVRLMKDSVAGLDSRLARVENQLTHVPTNAKLLAITLGCTLSVISAMGALMYFFAKPWVEQILEAVKAAA